MNTQGWISAALAVIGTLTGIFYTQIRFKRQQKLAEKVEASKDSHLTYDQLQEDLKDLRDERARDLLSRAAERREDRAEVDYLNEVVRFLEDELTELRQDIAAGTVPPLAPRKPWPKRPAL